MARRLRRLPGPLVLLLVIAAVEAVAWIVVMPPLQGPDEISHFTYTQRMVETGSLPFKPNGKPTPQLSPYSSEVNLAVDISGLAGLAANVEARPLWTGVDEQLFERRDRALGPNRSDGGFTSAFKNPPLYYMWATVPYVAGSGGSFFDRHMLMRLWNIPLLLAVVIFAWLVAGELVGGGRWQTVATAAVVALPQLLNVTATINPDILVAALWSAALWLMIRISKEGPSRRLVAWLGVVSAAAFLTHARSLPLLAPLALLAVLSWRRKPAGPVALGAATVAGTGLVALVAAEVGRGSAREFASYVWQFYLPKLGFMTEAIGPPGYRFRQAFPDRLYGTLAQLEVILPRELEAWLYRGSIAALAALVVALWVHRASVRAHLGTAVVLVVAIFTLLIGLHLAAYRAMVTTPADPILTARYVLPLAPLFGAAIALIGRALPRTIGAAFAGLVLGVGVALQFESIGLLLERFYA